ncbi:uncharacterized protein MKK02DRAFT_44089 [Dioszegia hungarica]|uniref:Uncharacterized protein n=1 Tax=Dioszegia hungarica TaxID=4972 RepID=A0AA38LVJ5_9TREE|nr:uncharacterized protein MKK02DRAFT_44089 [Dioszegia hungarica]KAI9635401.1 hypothetical protein MKK02DRAFT_44089 [Dioszegia hungarica]
MSTNSIPKAGRHSIAGCDPSSTRSVGQQHAPWLNETSLHGTDLANLSPIVKHGSLRRQHGHVRLAALQRLARSGAIRIPPPDAPPPKRQSLLPREMLDRSLPPVPPSPAAPKVSPPRSIKRKAVPEVKRSLPPTPTPPKPAAEPVRPHEPIPSPLATTTIKSPIRWPGLSPRRNIAIQSPAKPAMSEEVMSESGRPRVIVGPRVKEAVERIENTTFASKSPLSTPVKAIGDIVERPSAVSSAGLSTEARKIMADARFKRSNLKYQ